MDPLCITYNDKKECQLCPHYCRISKGKSGICGVRRNNGDTIELVTYGYISACSLDPVEKKPLYHFYPGKNILSVGSFGCNLKCDFCQNFHISQIVPENLKTKITVEQLVSSAMVEVNNTGIAFTYNEPIIWFEFMRDAAISAREAGLCTAMVSNGYVNSKPLNEIIQFTDAFNIDLKAFNNDFYRKLTGSDLEQVKKCLKQIALSGKHLEITTLIIPGKNDSEDEMARQAEWIAGELGNDIPLHLSRYFPMYKREDPATSQETLSGLYSVASEKLKYVYLGNINSLTGNDTFCPDCHKKVTERRGYSTSLMNLDTEGRCSGCGTLIYKHFASTF